MLILNEIWVFVAIIFGTQSNPLFKGFFLSCVCYLNVIRCLSIMTISVTLQTRINQISKWNVKQTVFIFYVRMLTLDDATCLRQTNHYSEWWWWWWYDDDGVRRQYKSLCCLRRCFPTPFIIFDCFHFERDWQYDDVPHIFFFTRCHISIHIEDENMYGDEYWCSATAFVL